MVVLYFYILFPLKKVRTGTQDWNLEAVADADHRGMLFTGLIIIVYAACFFKEPRTTSPEMAPSTIICAFSHPSLIKKMSYNQILERHFLS